jgi:hypothetical protein
VYIETMIEPMMMIPTTVAPAIAPCTPGEKPCEEETAEVEGVKEDIGVMVLIAERVALSVHVTDGVSELAADGDGETEDERVGMLDTEGEIEADGRGLVEADSVGMRVCETETVPVVVTEEVPVLVTVTVLETDEVAVMVWLCTTFKWKHRIKREMRTISISTRLGSLDLNNSARMTQQGSYT